MPLGYAVHYFETALRKADARQGAYGSVITLLGGLAAAAGIAVIIVWNRLR